MDTETQNLLLMGKMQGVSESKNATAAEAALKSTVGALSARWAWVFLILILGLTTCARVRLLAIPLERDEGEFAYVGQLILQGIPPYLHAYTMKLPGTHVAYALIMAVLGQTVEAVHIGLLIVNAATIVLLFTLVQRLFGNLAGLGAGATFALLSLTPPVLGTSAHATHFVLLPALAALLLLVRAADPVPARNLLFSGILLGVGVLMKQPGLFFLALAVVVVVCDQRRNIRAGIRRGLLVAVGAAIPYGVTCLVLWAWGVFDRFWFWTAKYGWAYSSILPLSEGHQLLYSQFAAAARSGIWLWCLGAAGLLILPLYARRVQDRRFALAFMIFSFLAVCPGFYFRRHYWILFLPAVAMFAGVALDFGARLTSCLTHRRLALVLPLGAFLAACAATVQTHSQFLFRLIPAEACRALYGNNPFAEAPVIGKYVQEHTTRADTVAVIGSEPEICFYSRRLSATGHIYAYGMMEDQPYATTMQQEMMREIEASKPKYMVFVNLQLSWLTSSASDPSIFSWFERYRSSHYRTIRIVDLAGSSTDDLSQHLPAAAVSRTAASPCYLEILERTMP